MKALTDAEFETAQAHATSSVNPADAGVFAWAWKRHSNDGHGVYFENPGLFGIDMTSPGYTWTRLYDSQVVPTPEDFITHRDAWRSALELAANRSGPPTEDGDDRAYWAHELKAFDRAYSALGASVQHYQTTLAGFQPRVLPWLHACFGERIASDRTERNNFGPSIPGLTPVGAGDGHTFVVDASHWERRALAAEAALTAERERCARACEALTAHARATSPTEYFDGVCRSCAAAVRALPPPLPVCTPPHQPAP